MVLTSATKAGLSAFLSYIATRVLHKKVVRHAAGFLKLAFDNVNMCEYVPLTRVVIATHVKLIHINQL